MGRKRPPVALRPPFTSAFPPSTSSSTQQQHAQQQTVAERLAATARPPPRARVSRAPSSPAELFTTHESQQTLVPRARSRIAGPEPASWAASAAVLRASGRAAGARATSSRLAAGDSSASSGATESVFAPPRGSLREIAVAAVVHGLLRLCRCPRVPRRGAALQGCACVAALAGLPVHLREEVLFVLVGAHDAPSNAVASRMNAILARWGSDMGRVRFAGDLARLPGLVGLSRGEGASSSPCVSAETNGEDCVPDHWDALCDDDGRAGAVANAHVPRVGAVDISNCVLSDATVDLRVLELEFVDASERTSTLVLDRRVLLPRTVRALVLDHVAVPTLKAEDALRKVLATLPRLAYLSVRGAHGSPAHPVSGEDIAQLVWECGRHDVHVDW